MLHCEENAVATPERSNFLQCAGPWLLFTGHSSVLENTLQGRSRKADLQAPWPHCSWTRGTIVAVAVAPTQKKNSKTKSVFLVRNKEETGPTEQKKEVGPEITTWSLLPQERVFWGPKRASLGFWDSCCGDRRN